MTTATRPAALPANDTASAPKARKGAAVVTIDPVEYKPRKHLGKVHQQRTDGAWKATVAPGLGIRIQGTYTNSHKDPKPTFDRTFAIGDVVEHGSYNVSYTGKILAITPSYVEVDRSDIGRSRGKRLSLAEFIWRNWDLDLAEIARRNNEWRD